MKFFFEGESEKTEQAQPDSNEKQFFFMLQEAGVVQPAGEKPQEISADASMKTLAGRVITLEYGTYESTYSIAITPTHEKRNLSNEQKVYNAMYQLASIMNEYVPPTLKVKLFPPRADWQMKVINAVIEDGASAWNFDIAKFELEGIPRLHEALEKIAIG